jgi:hypothetical protein
MIRRLRLAALLTGLGVVLAAPHPAAAQQSISEALSFLLSSRPFPTDDLVPSLPAGTMPASAGLAEMLRRDIGIRPMTSPAGGLAFEWDAALGTIARRTESFGPFFTSRARATGLRRASITFGLRQTEFDTVDGAALLGEGLVAASSEIAGETAPFDVQTVSLRLRARSATFTGEVGIAERLDFVVAVPFVEVILTGERIDRYRGTVSTQATAFASASGLGDVVMRAKYEAVRAGPYTLAVGGEVRLPTGNTTNSLGTGERRLAPQVIASLETRRMTVHAEGAFSIGELNNALHYGGAFTIAPAGRVSLVGEVLGRTDFESPALVTVRVPHPRLAGVTTTLAGSSTSTRHRLTLVAGVKWNVAGAWLVNAHVLRPLTDGGFTTAWSPAITMDYFFQQ